MKHFSGIQRRRCARFLSSRDFRERPGIGADGFRDGLAVDKLPFAAAGDQARFAQNFQMVGDRRGGHAAHRDDLAAGHALGCGDGFKNSEARLVGQGFRYFFDLGTVHELVPV